MTSSLQLVRNADGQVRYRGDLPKRHVFSASYVQTGGIPGVLEEHRQLTEAGEDAGHLNLTPMFRRDGEDIVFDFPDGEVRYRFVGFEEVGEGPAKRLNYGALVFELDR